MTGECRWYYKDPTGLIQGPFTQNQMSQWYDLGYFQDELEIAFGENSLFLPLYEYKSINFRQFTGAGPPFFPAF